MNSQTLDDYGKIALPPSRLTCLIEELKTPLEYHLSKGKGCDPGINAKCLANGVALCFEAAAEKCIPETAIQSLRKVLKAKNIVEKAKAYPVRFRQDASFSPEEFSVKITLEESVLCAADTEAMRRAVYFFEDRMLEAEGASASPGEWRRKPFVKHRISRCVYGPSYRPPDFIDELDNDVDYYPEEYLHKLAHEGVNGLWITMYFFDLPSSIFPDRGKKAAKRFAKLRSVVERCARYGIKIYVFFSEPKQFGPEYFCVPMSDGEKHPELIGARRGKFGFFCTSAELGKAYLSESVATLFKAVPQLGGIINIMSGEDNGACINHILHRYGFSECPTCRKRQPGDVFRESAAIMAEAMHRFNPEAEFIGWFYDPNASAHLFNDYLKIAEKWPHDCTIMFNSEAGCFHEQLGRKRKVFDYSLVCSGVSDLFRSVAQTSVKSGAKIQVGCSHENASVPFVPVPSCLYEKYRLLHECGTSAVMYCWYFGNYPGIMNRAAGMLSFEPLPANEDDFLVELARPDWRKNAPEAVEVWKCFARAYKKIPASLPFAWYGPLNHSIVWPLYLYPVNQPILAGWNLGFPKICGDKLGECLHYTHTLAEALTLLGELHSLWEQGTSIMRSLRTEFSGDLSRQRDIDLTEAILLQIKSTCNIFQFYAFRENMFYRHENNLEKMRILVMDEIENTENMRKLCLRDPRLGFHAETGTAGFHFYPEKLEARIKLLQELLNVDFKKFSMNMPFIDEYTGAKPSGKTALCGKNKSGTCQKFLFGNASWTACCDGKNLHVTVNGLAPPFTIAIEPCRIWTPLRITVKADGKSTFSECVFCSPPEIHSSISGEKSRITIPLEIFAGFRYEGFPFRINLWNMENSWVERTPWPGRILQGDNNPENMGWLIFE